MVIFLVEVLAYGGGFPVYLDFVGPIFFHCDLGIQKRHGSIFLFLYCELGVGNLVINVVGEFLHMCFVQN